MTSITTAVRIAVLFAIAVMVATPLCPRLLALDDHNPIGVTGAFEGVTTTGCAYNVLNHNATRQIDDIVVPGAIGKYGLKMTRYYNSRAFGDGWSHEYAWHSFNGKVSYPNGTVWDSSCTESWGLPAPLGVSDSPTILNGSPAFRLADGGTVVFGDLQWTAIATKIIDPYGQETNITLGQNGLISRVTEPGGRYLEFIYSTVNGVLMLTRVDAYDGPQGHRIDYVIYNYTGIKPAGGGTSGQPVNCLTRVDYSDGTQAFYTYQDDNVPDQPTPPCPCSIKLYPLLRTCRDVRYRGPMRHICYEYQTNGPHGAIIAEKYSLNGSTDGPRVSRIDPPAPSPIVIDPFFETTYIETRGDGTNVTRSFTYTPLHFSRVDGENVCPSWIPRENNPAPQQFLRSYTDFEGNTTYLDYDLSTWYVNSVRDARGNTTAYARASPPPQGIGQVTDVTYPNNTGTVHYDYQPEPRAIPGHYLTGITINRGVSPAAKTIHTRDSNHRITLTDYMEGNTVLARETFTYCDQPDPQQCSNNPLGQIKTQKLKNGAYVHYRYDVRGLLLAKTEPTWIADGPNALSTAPKTTYTYYSTEMSYNVTINGVSVIIYPWTDRLKKVTLPANESGLQASDTYEYDRVLDSYPNGITNLTGQARPGRGLVTKITHADTPTDTYQQFKYDAYGNKRWEDNELRNITTYVYDEYNRVLSVNRPLNQITTYTYNPTNGSSYTHTINTPDTITVRASPTNIVTTNVYDKNFRKTSSTVAGSRTWFHYDPVGNQDYVTDPRGSGSGDSRYTTYTDYDERNRKWQTREPLGRTTWFEYGDNINITKIHRPDGSLEGKVYDGMNRLITDTVPKEQGVDVVTQFQYYPYNVQSASLLKKVLDGENHSSQFEYDAAGLKTKMTYHDNSFQSWANDDAHNLESRTTVAGEIQNFAYDTRNRKIREWWDGWPADGEWRAFDYDDAGHLTLATNGTGTYWTNFIADVRRSYDGAGRLTQDQQTVYVNGVQNTKNVNYPSYDDDGKLLRMYVGGVGYDYTFSYDSMGRFEKIFITGNNNIQFEYSYDPASNETQRFNWVNRVAQIYVPDELNRKTSVELRNTNVPSTQLGIESYEYYTIGRLRTVAREDNKQDQFTYYLNGELKQATYGLTATPPPTPPPGATPAAPIARAATNVTSTGFTANWSSVSGASGYRLDVSTISTFANYVFGYQDLNVGNVTSRAVSGLAANTTYYYRLRAYNANGTSGNSNVINVMTAVANQVAEPRFNPDGGSTNQHSLQVTVSTATSGAQMRYTINDPTPPSRTYGMLVPPSGNITLTLGHATLQAIAYKNGMTDSPIHAADYDYENGEGPSVYPLDNAGPPPAGPVAPDLGGTFTYTLDKAGNRTALNNINYSPNSINQYTSVGGIPVTNATDHQIQVYGGFTYTYMRDQELKRITATGLTFDVAYDALGRCVKRTVNGDPTYYIYDGVKPILEYRSDGTIARNLYGKGTDEILQRIDPAVNGGGAFYFQQDHEGSVTHLTNQNNGSGQIIERYRYDVFGAPIIYTPPPNWTQRQTSLYNNRWLFTGREYLGAWVYDYRARVYHTYLGRFMSEDPKGFVRRINLGAAPSDWSFSLHPEEAEFNLFRYCGNDPIDFMDPMGLYGEGSGWTPDQWKKFDHAQQTAAQHLEGAVNRMVLAREAGKDSMAFKSLSKDFQKVFHKEATPENLSKVSQVARKMITALRDDGSKGYFANGRPGSWFSGSSVFGLGVVGGKNIWINVDHSRFGEPFTLAHVAGHESGHNAGLPGKTGVDVYKWQKADYERLTPEQRLDNADSYMEFLTGH